MRSVYAIYRKEMGHYFVSPVAYVVVAVFLILARLLLPLCTRDADPAIAGDGNAGHGLEAADVPGEVLNAFFGLLSTLILFLAPMLTMGVYAEERKRGTMELLMTSPITELQIVLGKFFASLTLFAIMLLPTAALHLLHVFHSDPGPPWR